MELRTTESRKVISLRLELYLEGEEEINALRQLWKNAEYGLNFTGIYRKDTGDFKEYEKLWQLIEFLKEKTGHYESSRGI